MHYGLAIISMPSSSANLTKAFAALPRIQAQLPRLRMVYCKIFRENSIKLRIQLFSNELMQCVWMLYAHDEAAEIRAYLSKLREVDPNLFQLTTLLKDITLISQLVSF